MTLFSSATSRPMLSLEATSPAAEEVESEDSDLVATQIVDDVYKWLSVDPLSDKYPNISPYAYCAWNPVKFIDPDGEKCQLSIKGNTIIVSANYYVLKRDYVYAQKAVDFWNNQNNLKYTAEDGTVYSVRFSLNLHQSKHPEESAGVDGNTFKIVQTLGCTEDGHTRSGCVLMKSNSHISVADAYKEKDTGAHEVGHTLMNVQENGNDGEHSRYGIMTKYQSDRLRSALVSQETVDKIVESNGFNNKLQILWKRLISRFW